MCYHFLENSSQLDTTNQLFWTRHANCSKQKTTVGMKHKITKTIRGKMRGKGKGFLDWTLPCSGTHTLPDSRVQDPITPKTIQAGFRSGDKTNQPPCLRKSWLDWPSRFFWWEAALDCTQGQIQKISVAYAIACEPNDKRQYGATVANKITWNAALWNQLNSGPMNFIATIKFLHPGKSSFSANCNWHCLKQPRRILLEPRRRLASRRTK